MLFRSENTLYRKVGEVKHGQPKTLPHNQNQLTIEQKKTMGLCFKCNDKYYYGHKCSGKGLHSLEVEDEDEEEGLEEITEGLTVEETEGNC